MAPPTVPVIVHRADEYRAAGDVFTEMATDSVSMHSALVNVVTATAGMAGDDSIGQKWAGSYDQAAHLAVATSAALTTACSQIHNLIVTATHNHHVAETNADARDLPTPPAPPLSPELCLPETVPPAAGHGIPQPLGWSIIADAVGCAWPDGHQDQLATAATAWHTMSSDFRTLASQIPHAVDLLGNQQSAEIPTAIDTCNTRGTDLSAAADACQNLGDTCRNYAHYLDDAHHKIITELEEFAIETAAAETAFAVLAPVTASVSEWVGNTATTARVAAKARRVAAIISELATKVDEIVSHAIRPLIQRLKPLLDRVSAWVTSARATLLGRSGPAELYSRAGAHTNREVLDNNIGLPRTLQTVQYYARLAGVDLRGTTIDIVDDPDTTAYLDYQHAIARTDNQGIQLGAAAFSDPETLVRTLGHESVHVRQYADGTITTMTGPLEDEAYAAEDQFVATWRRNTP